MLRISGTSNAFGSPPNYSKFGTDGGLTAYGNARRWVDFNFSAISLGTGASAPDPVQVKGGTIFTRAFDGNVTAEQLFGSLELNHNWAEGTIIKPHVHWMPTTTNAGNVKWRLTWAISQDGLLTGENTVTAVSAAGGVAWVEKRADFTDINLAGYKIGAQFMYRLWRDPANADGQDTYPDDAAVQTFGLHVLIDTLGSAGVGTK